MIKNCKDNNIAHILFTEVTGNRVSDHYARNVYIKVFLKIAVPWRIIPSIRNKIYSFENIYNKYCAGLQHETSPVVLFSRIFLYTRNT